MTSKATTGASAASYSFNAAARADRALALFAMPLPAKVNSESFTESDPGRVGPCNSASASLDFHGLESQ